MIISAHPASTGGAYRDRHGRWQRDAVDEKMFQRACAPTTSISSDGQAVWSCPPDAGVNPRVKSPGGWWLTSPVHQGERGAAVKTIAQGRLACFGVPVVNSCAFCANLSHTSLRVLRHPVFPAPLCPGNLSECANGRLDQNRPLLELSPLRPKATELVRERGTAPVSSSTRTVARASSPNRARKGVDDGTN
jgi:hypothetical protein